MPDVKALPSLAALSQYEGVKLFIERAVASKHDFAVTNENAPAIAGICERVDGLPLAIELAAARVKLFSPQALLGRLETSLNVLAGGSRDLPSRQQTLRGAIAWSYDLLDEPQRRLFARISVFARGANLEQVEAVCGPASELGVDVLSGLDELADQSLLRRLPDFDEPRLLMLHVMREFAAEKLAESGESAVIHDRHAAAYQDMAEAAEPHLFGSDQKKWLDRLEMDYDNFRAAFDWAQSKGDSLRAMSLGSAFWRYWQMRGHLREGRARLEAVLSMPSSREHVEERAMALEAAGGIAYWQGDMPETQTFYDESLALVRQGGNPERIANALYNDSFPSNVTGKDIPKARALLDEALPIYRQLGDEPGIAKCLWALGQSHVLTNDDVLAAQSLDEAASYFRKLGNLFGLGWAQFLRALLALKMSDLAAGKALAVEALKIFADANDVSGVVLVLDSMAEVAFREGDMVTAARIAGAKAAHEVASGAGLTTVVAMREGWRSDQALASAEGAAWTEGQAMTLEQAVAYALRSDPAVRASA